MGFVREKGEQQKRQGEQRGAEPLSAKRGRAKRTDRPLEQDDRQRKSVESEYGLAWIHSALDSGAVCRGRRSWEGVTVRGPSG